MQPMNVDDFWAVVDATDAASGGEVELYGDTLRRTLSSLTSAELVSFDNLFGQHAQQAFDSIQDGRRLMRRTSAYSGLG
jgi:hypothetical protein